MQRSLQQTKEDFHSALCYDDFSRAETLLEQLTEEDDFALLYTLFHKVTDKKPLLKEYTGEMPKTICISPSYTCKLGCEFCLAGFAKQTKAYKDEDYLPAKEFKKILPWLEEAESLSFCGIGETLESPDMFNYLEILGEELRKKIPINIVSNTILLNKENIKKFVSMDIRAFTFSIDSISPLGHGAGNSTFQEKAWEKVQWVQEEKKRQKKDVPYFLLNSVLTKENIETLAEHLEVAHKRGINKVQLLLMIPQEMRFLNLSLLPEIEENLKRIKSIIQKWEKSTMEVELINGQSPIMSDVSPHCSKIGNEASFVKDLNHPIPCCGELILPHKAMPEYSLKEYWNSFSMRLIRYSHDSLKEGDSPVACTGCAEFSIETFAKVKKERLKHPQDDLYEGYAKGVKLENAKKKNEAKELFLATLQKHKIHGSHATRGRIYLHLCEIALAEENYNEAMDYICKAVYYQFNHRKAFSYLYLLAMLTGKETKLQGS